MEVAPRYKLLVSALSTLLTLLTLLTWTPMKFQFR